ncbi:MAG: hypothetical protein WCL71_11340, partial [Deltaproteobacteria bacterium]
VPNSLEGAPITYGKGTIGSYARFNNPNSNTLVSTSNGSVTPGIAFGTFSGTTSTHRKLGTSAIIGAEPYLPLGGNAISTNGPCVTCHMKADNPVAATNGVTFTPPAAGRPANGHSLLIDDATGNQLCLQCHNDNPNLAGGDGKGNAINVYYKTYADLVATQVEPQSECYQNGLGLLKKILLVKYMIKYDPAAYPYFYDMKKDPTGKTSMTDWTRAAVAGDATATAAVTALGSTFTPVPTGGYNDIQAKRLMGACFNLNLMARDAGGFLHARTFVQRLVYDALDYLDNNKMDFTALTSARKLNPTVYYGTNVNVFASNGTLASESMIWMSGTHFSAAKATSATKNTDLVPMKLHP